MRNPSAESCQEGDPSSSVPAPMCVPPPPSCSSRPASCLWLIIVSMHDALLLCSLQISLLHYFAHLLIFLSSPPCPVDFISHSFELSRTISKSVYIAFVIKAQSFLHCFLAVQAARTRTQSRLRPHQGQLPGPSTLLGTEGIPQHLK